MERARGPSKQRRHLWDHPVLDAAWLDEWANHIIEPPWPQFPLLGVGSVWPTGSLSDQCGDMRLGSLFMSISRCLGVFLR